MKKTLVILSAILIIGALLCSCTKDAYVPAGYKRISDDGASYRLYVPESWIEDVTSSATSAYVSKTDSSNISFVGFEIDDAIIQAKINKGATEETTENVSETTATETPTAAETTAADETTAYLPEITTPEEYWDYYETQFISTFGDMKYETKGGKATLSGIESKKYEYTATVTGAEYKFMQIITLKNGYVYIFTYTALPENYDNNIAAVNEIIDYVEIK